MGCFGTVDSIASAVVYLGSDRSFFMAGVPLSQMSTKGSGEAYERRPRLE
jgi:hypothetical protein